MPSQDKSRHQEKYSMSSNQIFHESLYRLGLLENGSYFKQGFCFFQENLARVWLHISVIPVFENQEFPESLGNLCKFETNMGYIRRCPKSFLPHSSPHSNTKPHIIRLWLLPHGLGEWCQFNRSLLLMCMATGQPVTFSFRMVLVSFFICNNP